MRKFTQQFYVGWKAFVFINGEKEIVL